jgi:hypothetical protein
MKTRRQNCNGEGTKKNKSVSLKAEKFANVANAAKNNILAT